MSYIPKGINKKIGIELTKSKLNGSQGEKVQEMMRKVYREREK